MLLWRSTLTLWFHPSSNEFWLMSIADRNWIILLNDGNAFWSYAMLRIDFLPAIFCQKFAHLMNYWSYIALRRRASDVLLFCNELACHKCQLFIEPMLLLIKLNINTGTWLWIFELTKSFHVSSSSFSVWSWYNCRKPLKLYKIQ